MPVEAAQSENATETDFSMMRPRGLFIGLLSYVASIFRSPTRYVPLPDETKVTQHSLNNSLRVRTVLSSDLPFLCGLPLSILLLYIHPFLALLGSFGLLLFVLFFLFRLVENSLVYAASEPPHSRLLCDSPEKYNFPTWESVELYPNGKQWGPKVTGYLILNQDATVRSTCPTFFFLHGNAGNIGHRLPLCRLLYDNIQCNIFIIDYRGFGRSTGSPSEQGLYADARSGLDYLQSRADISSDKIFVLGRSIGGAVAIQLATTNSSLCGVIIENSFTSLPEAAQHVFGKSFGEFTRYLLPSWMFFNQYQSLERLRSLARHATPKFLFVSGNDDELIPPKMMRDLASIYRQNCALSSQPGSTDPIGFIRDNTDGLVVFPDGQHNTTWLCPNWVNVIAHFVRKTCSSGTRGAVV